MFNQILNKMEYIINKFKVFSIESHEQIQKVLRWVILGLSILTAVLYVLDI